jgi:hypothetical protein
LGRTEPDEVDTGRQISNVRTLVVFSDGLVVCAVGVRGIKRFTLGPVPHGELLALVLIRLMGPFDNALTPDLRSIPGRA